MIGFGIGGGRLPIDMFMRIYTEKYRGFDGPLTVGRLKGIIRASGIEDRCAEYDWDRFNAAYKANPKADMEAFCIKRGLEVERRQWIVDYIDQMEKKAIEAAARRADAKCATTARKNARSGAQCWNEFAEMFPTPKSRRDYALAQADKLQTSADCGQAESFWSLLKTSTDRKVLEKFAEQNASCPQAEEARARLKELGGG